MAKKKVKEVEDIIVEDATVVEQDVQEVILNVPAPVERQDPGHSSRDFRGNL